MTDSFKKTILYREYPEVAQLVTRLHELSEQQDAQGTGISSLNDQNVQKRDFSVYKDKMVALEQDKSELIYAVLRNKNARRIFEAGTSYGVSTIYLLLASQAANAKLGKQDGPPAMVWGTEKEENKADAAMANLAQAMKLPDGTKDIPGFTMLRGDILELTENANIETDSLDAVLFDIWAESEYPLSTMMKLSSDGRPRLDTDSIRALSLCVSPSSGSADLQTAGSLAQAGRGDLHRQLAHRHRDRYVHQAARVPRVQGMVRRCSAVQERSWYGHTCGFVGTLGQ